MQIDFLVTTNLSLIHRKDIRSHMMRVTKNYHKMSAATGWSCQACQEWVRENFADFWIEVESPLLENF